MRNIWNKIDERMADAYMNGEPLYFIVLAAVVAIAATTGTLIVNLLKSL